MVSIYCCDAVGFWDGVGVAQDSSVKTFPTYRAAADAFVSAVKAKDNAALREILEGRHRICFRRAIRRKMRMAGLVF